MTRLVDLYQRIQGDHQQGHGAGGAEIIPGRPPAKAVTTAMQKEA
ncbi:hypothetical protein ACFSKY_09735 [Azotobacter chroococcum]|nr:hypothetical protein [Azotobacter chroococcum]